MSGVPRLADLVPPSSPVAAAAERAGIGADADVRLIVEGGSDRRFYRLAHGAATAVLLHQPGGGPECDDYLRIGRFLREQGIGVPEIREADCGRGLILMEDLGDMHLDRAMAGADRAARLERYREAIAILARLQTGVTSAMERQGLLAGRIFAEEALLGETEYFVREFLDGCCAVPLPPSWEAERRELARTLAAERPVFMHRDFQSRNLMVKDGRVRVVDFQTAHRGPGLYDLASLLKDPYHPVPRDERRELARELHERTAPRPAPGADDFDEWYDRFTAAGIQRNLQALAAYAKLGLRKGKPVFLASIPPAIDLLQEGAREAGRFPGIERMAAAIRERLEREPGLLRER